MTASGALAGLKTDLERWALARSWHGLQGGAATLFTLLGLMLVVPLAATTPRFALLGGAVYVGLMAGWMRWRAGRLERWGQQLADELRQSGLIERLALEGMPTERAIDYVPLPLKLLFPRLRGQQHTLRSELNMVGSNLEWYLHPPRRLLKLAWLAPAGQLLTLLAAIPGNLWLASKVPYSLAFAPYAMLPLYIIVAGQCLCITPLLLSGQREAISRGILAEELLRHLKLSERKAIEPTLRAQLSPPGQPARPCTAEPGTTNVNS